MHINQAKLEISAVNPKQYPEDNLPEIALLGRSNVGKSSFINRMVERTKLARTSSQPGKTQTLNFYQFNQSFRIVDVPGYGYARVSKADRLQWSKMINQYLTQRENIHLILLLMDMRHEPSQLDREMFHYVDDLDIPFAIVLTKSDKISKGKWNQSFSQVTKALDLPSADALFPFSAETGEGADDIWAIIQELISQ